MSELNREKKNSKAWMVVVIYFLIAVIITVGLIIFENSKKIDESEVQESNQVKEEIKETKRKELAEVKGISLKDKYALNNLKLESIEEEIGEEYDRYDYDDDGEFDDIISRISIDYLQIDGLKNSYVERKINDQIKEKVEELKKEFINDEIKGKVNISVNAYTPGYGNVLTVDYSATGHDNTGEEYYSTEEVIKYDIGAFNFRLDTGEEISFEEIFAKDTDINFIISQSAYEHVISSMKYVNPDENEELDWDFDMSNIDYGKIENDVIRIVNKFKRNFDNLSFSLSSRMVTIYFDAKDNGDLDYLTIDMYDFVDNIAIYTRFLTEKSLYEGGDLEAKTYVFRYAIENDSIEQYAFEKISDNILVQISTNAGLGYEEQVDQRVDKVINYLIREANPNTVYMCSFYIDCEDKWEFGSGYIIKIPINYYKENEAYIIRYLDNSTELYEEPLFDENRLEYEYFDLYFDSNNDVTMVVQGEDYVPEVEGGTDEVLTDDTSNNQITNTISTNTINTNSVNTNSLSNTSINNTLNNNQITEPSETQNNVSTNSI